VPALLVFFEPDFGSAAVIMAIWVGMIMISRIQKKYLAALFLIFLLAASSLWVFVLKDFQKDRVRVFINPELDVKGRGYNVRQAIIAVGSGQMWGRGLGQGLQSTYKFLPEKQTDFIFAAAGEEVGFIGLTALLGLYFLMFYRLAGVMQKAKDELGMYLVGGVFFYLLSHVVVNVGMNIGLLPVTGIPLPFLSSGGSALVAALCALGIVQNVAMQSKFLRF
jgi:rod shape determining protein RodA